MSEREYESDMSELKCRLGSLIKECRGTMSQRKLAAQVGLVPSHMKAIEDGVHSPTPEVYDKLIAILKPGKEMRSDMDSLYMDIRKLPPPDICAWIVDNPSVIRAIRRVSDVQLTFKQEYMIEALFQVIEKEQASKSKKA